jgi:hypothetical protein
LYKGCAKRPAQSRGNGSTWGVTLHRDRTINVQKIAMNVQNIIKTQWEQSPGRLNLIAKLTRNTKQTAAVSGSQFMG